MRSAQLFSGLASLVLSALQEPVAPIQEDGRGRYYSGAEWVLDGEGKVLASSAVLVERQLDLPNRLLRQEVVRESPRERVLSRTSRTTVNLFAARAAPHHELEGHGVLDGVVVEVFEQVKNGVLVIRETIRDGSGRTLRIHILDATPLTAGEFDARRPR